MNIGKEIGYYFITDERLSLKGNESDVRNACEAGVKVIQYRNKEGSGKEFYEEAHKLRQICKIYDVKFIINDRIDVALAVDADGVHLGQNDIPYPVARKLLGKKKIIGVSTHDINEALIAQFSNVDYIGVGAIYNTETKKNVTAPKGPEFIKSLKKKINIPIVAIGGINLSNFKEVVEAGSDGFCAISDIVKYENMKERIKTMNDYYYEFISRK
jgi:thiamine-phosphate pyrophosphorylase